MDTFVNKASLEDLSVHKRLAFRGKPKEIAQVPRRHGNVEIDRAPPISFVLDHHATGGELGCTKHGLDGLQGCVPVEIGRAHV